MRQEVCAFASSVGGVIVHQSTPHIFQAYQQCSLLISTSLFEPFGLVIPEAMSCGLPVVAYDCPYGPADIITDGVDGFLIKNRDVNSFSQRVCQLIDNHNLRVQMGQEGIISSRRYNISDVMSKWIHIFEQLTFSRRK